jgi:hypothetical protein
MKLIGDLFGVERAATVTGGPFADAPLDGLRSVQPLPA